MRASAAAAAEYAGGETGIRRRRLVCVEMLAFTVPMGLAWRLAPLHLPAFAFKYGGSGLWAVAVYWLFGLIRPRWTAGKLAICAGISAFGVEFFKKVYWGPLDRFRESLAGKLLLGRYFSYGAILAYWVAIAFVALLDARFLQPKWRSEQGNARFGVSG
jgi:hypothetical protein